MKLPEYHTREKLETLNQLKIFLWALAAEYAPVFESFLDLAEPVMYPHGAMLTLYGSPPKHVGRARRWNSKLISRTRELCSGVSHKKWQFFLDYRCESPGDFTCCGPGPRRLLVFGGMKFFHVNACPLNEAYHIFASGEWPHMSVGLGLYLAQEYPGAEVGSLQQIKDLITGDQQNASAESAAMME